MEWERVRRVFSWKGGGIRRRLLIWVLSLLGMTLTLNTLAGFIYTRRQIKKHAAELQAEVASRVAREIEEFVGRKVVRLQDLSASASLHELGSEEQMNLAFLLLRNDSIFTEVAVLDDKGMEVLKISERKIYLPSDLSDLGKEEKFTKAFGGGNYVSRLSTSDEGEPNVTLAAPIKVAPEQIVGVIAAELNLSFLSKIVGDVGFGNAGYAYLVDRAGTIIAYRDPSLIQQRTIFSPARRMQESLGYPEVIDFAAFHEGPGIMGKPVLMTSAPVGRLGLTVIVEEPVDAALAELKRMERYAILLLGLGLSVGTVMVMYVSNKITKPIRVLHRGVEIIGSGNLDHKVEIQGSDETGKLAQEFNEMATELKSLYFTLEQKVEQRTKELSALYDVATTMNQPLGLDLILREATEKLLEVLRCDAARIFLLDREGRQLELRHHKGVSGELAQISPYEIGEGIIGKVIQSGEMMTFDDIQTDPQFQQLARTRLAVAAGFHAHVCFPLKGKERVLGVVNLFSYRARSFIPEEIRMLTSMANQIGAAVERANLFEEVVRKSKELEQLNRDLQEANRAKSEFMAAMSHELRTPLNVIIGNADLARGGFFGDINEKQKGVLEKILRYSRVLLKLIDDVLTLSKLEARKMSLSLSTFRVNEIITHAQSYVEQLNRNGHVKILWQVQPNLPSMTTDALKLEEILQNLIGNAYKFTPEGRIEVRVRGLQGKDRIEFAVADTGVGIDKSDLEKIFDKFHQLQGAHTGGYDGVGLGLSIVKSYLELMRGEIKVESQQGKGTTFTFTLPHSVQHMAD